MEGISEGIVEFVGELDGNGMIVTVGVVEVLGADEVEGDSDGLDVYVGATKGMLEDVGSVLGAVEGKSVGMIDGVVVGLAEGCDEGSSKLEEELGAEVNGAVSIPLSTVFIPVDDEGGDCASSALSRLMEVTTTAAIIASTAIHAIKM